MIDSLADSAVDSLDGSVVGLDTAGGPPLFWLSTVDPL